MPLSSCRTLPALACWCPAMLGSGCLLPTEQQISPCRSQKPEKVPFGRHFPQTYMKIQIFCFQLHWWLYCLLQQNNFAVAKSHFCVNFDMFYFCWCCLFVVLKLNFQRYFFASLPQSHAEAEQYSVCVREEGVWENGRERKNRAEWRKKHRKLRWEQNWIWGEMQFSNDISTIYNQYEGKLHPRAESSTCPQHRIEKRKNKRERRAGKERKEKEKSRFWEGQLLTWVGWPFSRGGLGLTESAGAEPTCCHLHGQHSTSSSH